MNITPILKNFVPTQKYLHLHFNYDPDTGVFSRKVKTSNRTKIGKPLVAGLKSGKRIIINIHNKVYKAHHLAWLYVYGVWPKEIDHINNDPTDNRIENLREVNRMQNIYNVRKSIRNKSGVKGVSWDEERKKWFVRIGYNKKNFALGRYDDFEEAVRVITEARKKYHGDFANFT